MKAMLFTKKNYAPASTAAELNGKILAESLSSGISQLESSGSH